MTLDTPTGGNMLAIRIGAVSEFFRHLREDGEQLLLLEVFLDMEEPVGRSIHRVWKRLSFGSLHCWM